MVKLLLAGTGLIGGRHLNHILEHPDLTFAGIIDPVVENRTTPYAPGFASFDEVDVDADGIILATPTDTHAPLTIAALDHGLHVLVEKPVSASLEEADAMIRESKRTGKKILVGHHRRHHPLISKTVEILQSGQIGRPLVASLLWCMKKPDDYFDVEWRKGVDGGPVKQNLIHDVDTLRAFFGEVTSITGAGSNVMRNAPRHENGGVVLTFDSGVIVTIAFSDATPTPWGFEAGTGENLHIPKTAQTSMQIACSNGGVEFPTLNVWSGAAHWNEKPEMHATEVAQAVPLIRQLEHFADVIRGKSEPVVDAASARETLSVILEIERATAPPTLDL